MHGSDVLVTQQVFFLLLSLGADGDKTASINAEVSFLTSNACTVVIHQLSLVFFSSRREASKAGIKDFS